MMSEKQVVILSFLHFTQVLKPLDVKTKFYNAEVNVSYLYLGLFWFTVYYFILGSLIKFKDLLNDHIYLLMSLCNVN